LRRDGPVPGEGDYEAKRRGRERARGEDRRDVMQDAGIDFPSYDKSI